MRFRGGVRQPIDFCVNRTSPSNVVISQGSPEEKRRVHNIAQGEGHFDRYRCCCRVTGTWQISFAKDTCSCDVTNFRLTDIVECDLYMTRDFVQRRVRTEVATRDKNDCATGHRTEAGWRNVINVRLLVKHECRMQPTFVFLQTMVLFSHPWKSADDQCSDKSRGFCCPAAATYLVALTQRSFAFCGSPVSLRQGH